MFRMLIILILIVFAAPVWGGDCGALKYKAKIEKTETLIISRAPIVEAIGEFPTRLGRKECVRFEFSITPRGVPFNITIHDTSGNTAFEVSALKALLDYRFKGRILGFLEGAP